MPYAIPTLATLQQQAAQDINDAAIGADGFLSRAIARVMAMTQAGFAYLHYDYQSYIARQAVPYTATGEFLDGWGSLKRLPRKAPTFAAVIAGITGATPGTVIPAATGYVRADGVTFASTAPVAVAGDGTAVVSLLAQVAGSASSTSAGTALSLATAVSGIPGTGWIAATATPGQDTETDVLFRTRVLDAFAAPGRGGDLADWHLWALSAPNVTRAWIAPNGMGGGTVVVYFVEDNGPGFPVGTNGVSATETRDVQATGDQLAVASVLDALRPVTALVYVNAPTDQLVPFTIAGLGASNTASNQAAIIDALGQMFLGLGNVGGTVDPDTSAPYPPIAVSTWYAAIAGAIGNSNFTVVSPTGPIVSAPGALPTLGPVTFQA